MGRRRGLAKVAHGRQIDANRPITPLWNVRASPQIGPRLRLMVAAVGVVVGAGGRWVRLPALCIYRPLGNEPMGASRKRLEAAALVANAVGVPIIAVTLIVLALLVRDQLSQMRRQIDESERSARGAVEQGVGSLARRLDALAEENAAYLILGDKYPPIIDRNTQRLDVLEACKRTKGCFR